MREEKFKITGMSCAACASNITKVVSKVSGVEFVNVNLVSNEMIVRCENKVKNEEIIGAVTSIGYGASLKDKNELDLKKSKEIKDSRQMKYRLIFSLIVWVPLLYLSMSEMLGLPIFNFFKGENNALILAITQLLLTLIIVYLNRSFYISGYKALFKRVPNMDSLVAIGSSAALIYGIVAIYLMAYGLGNNNLGLVHQYSHLLYFEGAATILTLVTLGKYFETKSKERITSSIDKLINLAPKMALVIRENEEKLIEVSEVNVGDIIVIKPGDMIPVNGIVIEGNGLVDESLLTGESIPLEKQTDDEVISATVNLNGSFKFKATKVGKDTTIAQIIKLVEEAGNSKPHLASIADKVSGIFVPIVLGISIFTFIIWMIINKDFSFALNNAISVLVISCPCALGLATPLSVMISVSKGAENGILIKSAESLEKLSKVNLVVFDKTGTLTEGKLMVERVISFDRDFSDDEIVKIAVSIEKNSNHPLAKSILDYGKGVEAYHCSDYQEIIGVGVKARVNEDDYLITNFRNSDCDDKEIKSLVDSEEKLGKTSLIVIKKDKVIGLISLSDRIKESSKAAIASLQGMGIKVAMLTGDSKRVANKVKEELGLDEMVCEVNPSEKDLYIKDLQSKGNVVAMVGDGINDSIALTRSDVGIAIASGSDIATDSADLVLIRGTLLDLVGAIKLSKYTINNIKLNLFWAFFYNALCIPLAAGVFYHLFNLQMSPMVASLMMSLSSISVVLSALTIKLIKFDIIKKEKGENVMKKEILIEGMMCNHCVSHVENALRGVSQVDEVTVSLKDKKAIVYYKENLEDSLLIKAIEDAGYKVVKIK